MRPGRSKSGTAIADRLDVYGPATCPRCGRFASVFLGRGNLICLECYLAANVVLEAEQTDDCDPC